MFGIIRALEANTAADNRLARQLEAHGKKLDANTAAVGAAQVAAERIAALLDQLLDEPVPDPGPLTLSVTGENGTMLTFKINLPAEPAEPHDIASGELTLTIAGGAPTVVTTTKEQTEVPGFNGEQGDAVEVSFAYIDDAGNKSGKLSTLSVVLADTLPPPDAGKLGLEVTSES